MRKYLLSVMKGQIKTPAANVIIYFLLPFSILYKAGLFCHRSFYQIKGRYKAPRPVISIGNIVVGGVGKTPLVIWLARHLQDKGIKSIILIRGHMPKASQDSDEADMLNEQIPYIPVLSGPDRIHHIRMTEDIMPVDVYICDDGFQHWPLARDLDLVAIDATNPFGNGHLLPAGVLREDLTALKRAQVFILTKTDGVADTGVLTALLTKINPKALIMESVYKSGTTMDVFESRPMPEGYLKGKPVVGFCAIGDPLSFEASLKNTGALISKVFTYLDHHVYSKEDILKMLKYCRTQNVQVLVTTHKDAVKLQGFKKFLEGIPIVYIPIQLEITKGTDEFFQKVISICFS